MQKILSKFSPEIREAVAAEKLVKIPRFPVPECYFVTPRDGSDSTKSAPGARCLGYAWSASSIPRL